MKTKISFIFFPLFFLSLFFLTSVSHATVVKKLTDEEISNLAQRIVIGRCISVRSDWNEDRTKIFTYVTVSPESSLKGDDSHDEIVIKQLGGVVGDIGLHVEGATVFEEGEEVMLFLKSDRRGSQRVLGLFQGKYSVKTDPTSGRKILVRKRLRMQRQKDGRIRREIVEIRSDRKLFLDEFTHRVKGFLKKKRDQ